MKTTNCPKCGLAISDEYQFCLQCGTDLKAGTDSQESAAEDSQVQPPTVVWVEPTQPSSLGPNVRRSARPQAPQSTILFQGPNHKLQSPSSRTGSPRSKLPWVVGGLWVLVVIAALSYLLLVRNKATETDHSIPEVHSATPSPTISPDGTLFAASSPTTPPTDTASPSTHTAATTPAQTPTPATASSTPPVEATKIYSSREVDKRVMILSKPKASYTDEARNNQVMGTVVLKVVFGANGSIENVTVVSGLSHGLTENAIAAARSMKFEPAQKNGVAVSTVMQVEYNFNLY